MQQSPENDAIKRTQCKVAGTPALGAAIALAGAVARRPLRSVIPALVALTAFACSGARTDVPVYAASDTAIRTVAGLTSSPPPSEPVQLSQSAMERRAEAVARCDAVEIRLIAEIDDRGLLSAPLWIEVVATALVSLARETGGGGGRDVVRPYHDDRARLRSIRNGVHRALNARTDGEAIRASDDLTRLCIP